MEEFHGAIEASAPVRTLVDSPCIHIHIYIYIYSARILLRHQACPRIDIGVGHGSVQIIERTIGGLTGSRIAGLLGRIPVESVMNDRYPVWLKWGYQLRRADFDTQSHRLVSDFVLSCSSYVDNLFAVSHGLAGAIAILEDFEGELSRKWGLSIKPSSRQCMAAAGSDYQSPDSHKWPQVTSFNVLGHTLANNGSIRPCWQHTRQMMWRSYWTNAGSQCARLLATPLRMKMLTRAVGPVFDYRCSRWPPQQTIGKEVDSTQCKMVAAILREKRRPGEEPAEYCRRRNRAASAACKMLGLWSTRWFKRALNWNSHVLRPLNDYSWCGRLVVYRGMQWLQARRVSILGRNTSQRSSLAGRTETRSIRAAPCTRWHDGIDYAKRVGS